MPGLAPPPHVAEHAGDRPQCRRSASWCAPPVPRAPSAPSGNGRYRLAALHRLQAETSRRQELDETRRLAYAVLHARRSRDGMIIATLVNALSHPGLAADPNAAAEHVAAVLNAPGLVPESEQWFPSGPIGGQSGWRAAMWTWPRALARPGRSGRVGTAFPEMAS